MNLEIDISFVMEVGRLKSIYRKALVQTDKNRFENSAEHSWHAMICAYALKDYFAPLNFDIDKALKMLLIHDIVEIDAGDTFVYGNENNLMQQKSKELAAANRIFCIPNETTSQELHSLWNEFNENKTDTAIFANAIDKIIPFILNANGNGGTWRNHSISAKKIKQRNEQLKLISPPLWKYLNKEIDAAIKKGWLTE